MQPQSKRVSYKAEDSGATVDEIIKTSDLISCNVLLADHGVVKVADFGMARQMKDYDYQKTGEVRKSIIIKRSMISKHCAMIGVDASQVDGHRVPDG